MTVRASGATYTEIARSESPRGELVLRERREAADPLGAGDGPPAIPHAIAGTPPIIELRVNGVFVMDTVETSSERAMASAALALVPEPAEVLIGGLGLGFTLAEVLADQRVRACTVVELEPVLVDWMRNGTVPHGPALIADARVSLVAADLSLAVAEANARPHRSPYDLVLLDVDNGPDYLVHADNAALYETEFLQSVRRLMSADGVLVIWSATHSPALEARLREVFGNAEATAYDVQLQGRDEGYWLHTARA